MTASYRTHVLVLGRPIGLQQRTRIAEAIGYTGDVDVLFKRRAAR